MSTPVGMCSAASTRSELRRTADQWSDDDSWETTSGLYWLQLPAVQRRWNMLMSGREDADWVDHALATYFVDRLPLGCCLSLGCGTGRLERQLATRGAFAACDACDIAEGAIEKARSRASEAGHQHIRYTVSDLNTCVLAANRYDAVWAAAAIHHVSGLEHLFAQIARSLKPDGLFLLNEYVGPSRFQFAARQREIIQACNDLLPPSYRQIVVSRLQQGAQSTANDRRTLARRLVAKLKGGDLVPALRRSAQRFWARKTNTRSSRDTVNLPTAASVAAVDPSEAVRSAGILPVLRSYFDVIEYRPLGGALLQFLLADIAGNFVSDEGARLLDMLFNIEDALMATGDLSSDFAYIVATPTCGARPETPDV